MVTVICNIERMEYDIHSILKAFYPGQEVRLVVSDISEQQKSVSWETKAQDDENWNVSEKDLTFHLFLSEEKMMMEAAEGPEGKRAGECVLLSDAESNGTFFGKDDWKRFLYDTLSEYTGKKLPWGNLTGIRPTKIAMKILDGGGTIDDAYRALTVGHRVSNEKADLSVTIALLEREILSKLTKDGGYSLYIGIPFCPSTCMYCSFTSFPIIKWQNRVDEYLMALQKEMEVVLEIFKGKMPDTIYIGGGTPTSLDAEALERLMILIHERFQVDSLLEFTVEAGRADSITGEKLRILKKYGVGRISVNPQTMNEETLALIGRKHTTREVVKAFETAREEGFTNINMDIILGLPSETDEMVQRTVDEIVKLGPDSLTVHSLAVKRASRMGEFLESHGGNLIHNTMQTMKIAETAAKQMGMKPYYLYRQKNMAGNFENVGYAKEGKYGIYNILIMEEKQSIAAIGAGSISKVILPDRRIERSDNVKDVGEYLARINEMLERKKKLFALLDKKE